MKGETLIEVLIALSAAVIVITAVSVLTISSLSNTQFVRDQDQASKYAQEGIELLRGIRNSSYVGYRSYNGTYCLAKDDTTLGPAVAACQTPNIDGLFIRSVTITQNGGCGVNLASTVVTVSWTSSKCAGGVFLS